MQRASLTAAEHVYVTCKATGTLPNASQTRHSTQPAPSTSQTIPLPRFHSTLHHPLFVPCMRDFMLSCAYIYTDRHGVVNLHVHALPCSSIMQHAQCWYQSSVAHCSLHMMLVSRQTITLYLPLYHLGSVQQACAKVDLQVHKRYTTGPPQVHRRSTTAKASVYIQSADNTQCLLSCQYIMKRQYLLLKVIACHQQKSALM